MEYFSTYYVAPPSSILPKLHVGKPVIANISDVTSKKFAYVVRTLSGSPNYAPLVANFSPTVLFTLTSAPSLAAASFTPCERLVSLLLFRR